MSPRKVISSTSQFLHTFVQFCFAVYSYRELYSDFSPQSHHTLSGRGGNCRGWHGLHADPCEVPRNSRVGLAPVAKTLANGEVDNTLRLGMVPTISKSEMQLAPSKRIVCFFYFCVGCAVPDVFCVLRYFHLASRL